MLIYLIKFINYYLDTKLSIKKVNDYKELINNIVVTNKQQLIIDQFYKLLKMRQTITFPHFFFDKKYDLKLSKEQTNNYINYLKEFSIFSDLIKHDQHEKTGDYINFANSILLKV